MSNKTSARDSEGETPDSIVGDTPEAIVEAREEMRSDPESMEKQHPSSPLAFVMGAYPIILIFLLIIIAAYFVMSRKGTSNIDPSGGPATKVPVESSLADPNP